MEMTLGNRRFYATFGNISVDEARESFIDYFGHEPEEYEIVGNQVIIGPVSEVAVKADHVIAGGE